MVGLQPSSSMSTGFVTPLSAPLADDGLAECDQPGKTRSLEIFHHGRKLNPGHMGTDREIHSILPLTSILNAKNCVIVQYNLYIVDCSV